MSDKVDCVKETHPVILRFVPLSLVVLGFIFCLGGAHLLGVIFGAVGGVSSWYLVVEKDIDVFHSEHTIIAAVVCVLLSLFLLVMSCTSTVNSLKTGGNSEGNNSNQNSAENTNAQASGRLLFELKSEEDIPQDAVFQVVVKGTSTDGDSVEDRYDATIGTTYQLDYKSGNYTISIEEASLTKGETVYKSSKKSVNFTGKQDKTVELTLSIDSVATKSLADSKNPESTSNQQNKNSSSSSSSSSSSGSAKNSNSSSSSSSSNSGSSSGSSTSDDSKIVYVSDSGKADCYHKESCSTLKRSTSVSSMTIADAKARGLRACEKCNPS